MSVETEACAVSVWTEGRMIFVELTDGRVVAFPADRFKRLSKASEEELREVKVEVNGYYREAYAEGH